MIGKVTKGHDFRGLCRYLVRVGGQENGDVHVDPHLVNGDPAIMAWYGSDVLGSTDGAQLAVELSRPHRVYGRAPATGPVWHASLAVKPTERDLSDEDWAAIGQAYVDGMEFTAESSGRAHTPWIALHHGTSANGNDHIHIVVSTVREDGTYVNLANDFARSGRVCRGIEERFGLERLESNTIGVSTRALAAGEQRRAERFRVEPPRRTLERVVRAAAIQSKTEADFVRRLRADDLRVAPRFAAHTDDVIVGYKVGLKGDGERMFGGYSLSKDLSLPRLRTQWEQSPENTGEAVEEWRRAARFQPPARAPFTPRITERATRATIDDYARLNAALAALPAARIDQWAEVARDAAGILATVSWRVEGRAGGPLRDAAMRVRLLGQINVSGTVQQHRVHHAARGAALLAAATVAGSSSTADRMRTGAILHQLTVTIDAVLRAVTAMRQARIAEALAAAVRTDLAAFQAAHPAISAAARGREPVPAIRTGSPVPRHISRTSKSHER